MNPQPEYPNERIVSLTADGETWRYGVMWRPAMRKYRVRAIDEGWAGYVCPGDVPGIVSARNVAITAVKGA